MLKVKLDKAEKPNMQHATILLTELLDIIGNEKEIAISTTGEVITVDDIETAKQTLFALSF